MKLSTVTDPYHLLQTIKSFEKKVKESTVSTQNSQVIYKIILTVQLVHLVVSCPVDWYVHEAPETVIKTSTSRIVHHKYNYIYKILHK